MRNLFIHNHPLLESLQITTIPHMDDETFTIDKLSNRVPVHDLITPGISWEGMSYESKQGM